MTIELTWHPSTERLESTRSFQDQRMARLRQRSIDFRFLRQLIPATTLTDILPGRPLHILAAKTTTPGTNFTGTSFFIAIDGYRNEILAVRANPGEGRPAIMEGDTVIVLHIASDEQAAPIKDRIVEVRTSRPGITDPLTVFLDILRVATTESVGQPRAVNARAVDALAQIRSLVGSY